MKNISNKILFMVMSACAVLLGIGNLMIVNALQEKTFNNAVLHIICGTAVFTAVFFCGKKRLLKIAPYLMAVELLLLLLCLIFGANVNGAVRWLRFGSFAFAPAMFAMPVLCLFWAYIREKYADAVPSKILLLPISISLLTAVLVSMEPFYSMTVFIIILTFVLFLFSGVSRKKIAAAAVTAAVIAAASVLIAINSAPAAMQKDFYSNLFSPDYESQYHTWSLLTTLKHSGFCGRHQVPAEPKYHIPNAITDSALIAGCGEFGYIFMIAALLLMAVIISCGVIIAKRCGNPTERLLTGGMTAVIALPALVNILMMFGLLPMGGVVFPFLAYSGTAMIANAFALASITLCARD